MGKHLPTSRTSNCGREEGTGRGPDLGRTDGWNGRNHDNFSRVPQNDNDEVGTVRQ